MNKVYKSALQSCLTILLLILLAHTVQADDVVFTLLEKNASYQMDKSGALNLVKYEFVSETLLDKEGAIVDGSVKRPGSSEVIFRIKASDSFYNRYADSYQQFELLDKAHPNDEYVINIAGKSNTISDLKLTFKGPEGKALLPDTIRIKLLQGNREKEFDQIDPNLDLRVVWSEFAKGSADPRGVMDDLVFAMVSDCHGNSVSRSGIPFIMPDYYTFRNKQHIVPADKLQTGLSYTVKVIHVNGIDTKKSGDTIAMATYNTSTNSNFQTLGENIGSDCPTTSMVEE